MSEVAKMRRQWRSIILLVLALSACVPRPIQPVPTPPAPMPAPTHTLVVSVCDGDCQFDRKVAGAEVSVAGRIAETDGAGNVAFTDLPDGLYFVSVSAAGFTSVSDLETSVPSTGEFRVPLNRPPPLVPALPKLHASDAAFYTKDATIWKWHGVTAFMLYQQFLDGKDISPFLAWAKASDINVVRVLGMYNGGIGKFIPADYGDRYLAQLSAFLARLKDAGLRVEFTVFADAQNILPSLPAQRAHLSRVVAILTDQTNVFGEIANEPFKNGVDPATLSDIVLNTGVLWATGNYDVVDNKLATLDYVTIHTERNDEWPRKAKDGLDLSKLGWDGFTALHKPVVLDEPMGIGPERPGARSMVASDFFDYFATGDLFVSGGTIHGDFGIATRIPSAPEQVVVDAISAAWKAVSPVAQLGEYTRGLLDSSPLEHADEPAPFGALRTFAMLRGNHADAVVLRPGIDWSPVGRRGWVITATAGDRRNIVVLDRH